MCSAFINLSTFAVVIIKTNHHCIPASSIHWAHGALCRPKPYTKSFNHGIHLNISPFQNNLVLIYNKEFTHESFSKMTWMRSISSILKKKKSELSLCSENKGAAWEAWLRLYIQLSLFVILANLTIFFFTTYNRCNQRTMNQLPRQKGATREKIQREEKGGDFSQGGTLLSKVTSAIF